MRQQTTLISKSLAASTTTQILPDAQRQYLLLVVETGSATVSMGGGDPFTITGSYEPILPPINQLEIVVGVGGEVVVVSNASTIDNLVTS